MDLCFLVDPHHRDIYLNGSSYLAVLNNERPNPNATRKSQSRVCVCVCVCVCMCVCVYVCVYVRPPCVPWENTHTCTHTHTQTVTYSWNSPECAASLTQEYILSSLYLHTNTRSEEHTSEL